ncbi:MAG TPA: hypothetical protein PL009_13435 [Flavipsychrobacter sp.]|nr:hypothetical protein [Flavipsychrobacter sp.]
MRSLFLALSGMFICCTSLAQNDDNFLQVNTNTTLSFIMDEPSDIETTQTLQNAISVQVRSKKDDCSISAKLTSFSYPTSYVPSSSMIALDWVSDNSNKDYNLNTGPISLTTMDQTIFSQKKHPHTFTYNYNLLFYPSGYNMVPGNYNFTILFTMTQL